MTRFNRRAAAAAREKNSMLAEVYSFLESAVSALQLELQRESRGITRSILSERFVGRCGVYQVTYARCDWDRTFSVRIISPDGRTLTAYLCARTLEVLPC